MASPEVMEVETQTEIVPPTGGQPGAGDAFAMMREALRETTPSAGAEPVETGSDPDPEVVGDAEPQSVEQQRPSRRARTVEKVKTDAEQKIADAEAARTAAETRAAELEARVQQYESSQTDESRVAAARQLEQEYGGWIGSGEQYQEAERLSRMDPDAEGWDWDRHKAAVANLEKWDERRKWADRVHEAARASGTVEAHKAIADDFLVKLANDLPEDKREAYRSHKDGIPGAVRYYAEAVAAPKIEALESKIAELEAENERLSRSGGGYRSPAAGAPSGSGGPMLDYRTMTPEQLMSEDLRQRARANGRRR